MAQYLAGKITKDITHEVKTEGDIGYVVPQYINAKHMPEKIKLFMRVKRVLAGKTIVAKIGDQVIAKKRANKFLPAEMVTIDVKKEDLVDGGEIVVEID